MQESIARIEDKTGKDWKYIRENWSMHYLKWIIKGYDEFNSRKEEQNRIQED